MIYLKLIPFLISLLSGHPDLASVANTLIGLVSQESRDDGVDRLVAMHFKNGLTYLQSYNLESTPEARHHDADLAWQSFVSASNVEKDLLRIGRAKLYISSASQLLGNRKAVLTWAEAAYSDLSEAESLAWRLQISNKDDVPLAVGDGPNISSATLYPLCDWNRDQEISYFLNSYKDADPSSQDKSPLLNFMNKIVPSITRARDLRNAKLREIYAYKAPLAVFLRNSGSKIKALTYPVTIPLDNYVLGAAVAVRLSDERCHPRH